MDDLEVKVKTAMRSSMESYLFEIIDSIEFGHGPLSDKEKDRAYATATKLIESVIR
jgi:hypothetical protein